MNFRPRRRDKPELNLIPMIDVLIVLLIFLVLTTTFRHESALSIRLAGGRRDVPVVIRADRNTPHQAVMTVLDVAGSLGFTQILFATREGRAVP